MTSRLYVGNLPLSATEEGLKERFGRSGTVRSVIIVMDASTGRSRCFGYVEMSSEAEAQAAIGRLNMTRFEETVMSVSLARVDQQPRNF